VQVGDRVRVQRRRNGRVEFEIGVVTRSDTWNGIWVGRLDTVQGGYVEVPLGTFASGGDLGEPPAAGNKGPSVLP
jgi:hypothetical protein